MLTSWALQHIDVDQIISSFVSNARFFYMGQFVQILNKGRLGRPCKGAGSFSKPYLLRTRDPNLRSAAFSQRVSQILMEIVPRTKKALRPDQIFRPSEGNCGKLGGNENIKIPHCLVCCVQQGSLDVSLHVAILNHTLAWPPARRQREKSQPALQIIQSQPATGSLRYRHTTNCPTTYCVARTDRLNFVNYLRADFFPLSRQRAHGAVEQQLDVFTYFWWRWMREANENVGRRRERREHIKEGLQKIFCWRLAA